MAKKPMTLETALKTGIMRGIRDAARRDYCEEALYQVEEKLEQVRVEIDRAQEQGNGNLPYLYRRRDNLLYRRDELRSALRELEGG